jgi:hypothetical protein
MMMTVDSLQGLNGHTEETSGFPLIYTPLHEPCGAGMPKRVRRHALQARPPASCGKAFLYVPEAVAIPIENEAQVSTTNSGPSKVWKEAMWNRRMGAAFIGLPSSWRVKIDASLVKIYLRPT